jgi:Concanavalin A-like lectin/glucanases superfamily/Secretion system C-terminal sorting domain
MKKYLLLLPLIVLVVLQKVNAQTPVAYYPFNGNANDAAGSLNGTVNGATLTNDRFGNANNAYSFDGVDDNISIDNNAVFNFTCYTISLWFRYNGPGTSGKSIWSLISKNANGNGFDDAFHLWVNATDKSTGGRVGNGSSEFYVGNPPAVDNGQWHHAALVFDNANDLVRLYLDGVFISAVPNTSNPFNNGASIKIGYWEAFNNFFNGVIDEIKIFNTVLTPAQVKQEFSLGDYGSQFNNSVKMNGVNDQIELGSTYTQQIFTVEMWVKPSATQLQYANIIDNNHTGTINWVCQQDASNLNKYSFGVNTNGVSGGVEFQLQPNVWQHVAMIKNATVVQVYVNGVLTQSSPISGSINYSGQFLRLGNWGGGGRNWNGTMDEVRYWGTARTQAEIVANMNNQLTGTEVDLIGYWDMNRSGQGSGLTVDNECVATGAALNGVTIGTASTPIFAPDVTQQKPGSGNAISFDGVNDNISVTTTGYTGIQTYTVECWIKSNSANPTVHIWESNSLSAPSLEGEASGGLGLRFYVGGSTSINTGVLNIGEWYHLACVYDKANTLQSLYVNGVLKGTNTVNVSDAIGANIGFGERLFGTPNNRFFNGELDDIRIWNTALTQSQIRDRMCRKITSSDALYPNLVAYYNFDESTGTTAFDGTANNNNGTLTNNPTRVTSGAAIGNASSHDYVNTTKTTNLTHASGESFTVTSSAGNPDGIHVYRVDEKPNSLTGTSGVGANDKYFGVFQVNGATPEYTAVYNYNGNPNVNAGNESQLRLNKRSDNAATSWTTMVALPDEPNNTITVTGESTEYILGTLGTPLPLNLISFSASKQNNDALLQWKTANEVGVRQFEVQRSNDGQNFATIGTIAAGGSQYSLTDVNIFSSRTVAFYRLKSMDADTRFTYSNIIKLSKQASTAVTVYPNPVSDVLTISGLKQNGTITLFNQEGKLLQQQTISAQTMTMDMSQYARGMYLLQYKTAEEVVNQKIIKQ